MTQPRGPAGCCAIVLAAGRGVRFGGAKLLATFRGAPLLSHPLRVLQEARRAGWITRTVVVLGPEERDLAILAEAYGAEPIHHTDPEADQPSSLRLGLRAAAGSGSALIVLGDQPLLRLEAIERILAAAVRHPEAVIRARYAAAPSIPGHPVLVPSKWWHLAGSEDQFRRVRDAGAMEETVTLTGANPDVDTPEDLHALEIGPD
jgi:CTP:molybdopterin cytidylyltransferase MocA